MLVLTTTAYAPLEACCRLARGRRPRSTRYPGGRGRPPGLRRRQVTWAETWPGPARARPGCSAVLGALALRGMRRITVLMRRGPDASARRAVLRGELGRGRARRRPLRLHAAEPSALPLAVVLGLVLRRDRLAAARARPLPARARRRSSARCATTASSATSTFWDRPISLQRLHLLQRRLARGAEMTGTIQPPLLAWAWRIAVGDPAEEPRIARHHDGSRETATSTATGCSGSSSPTSPVSTPRPSSTRSGAAAPTPTGASRCWSRATAGSAGTRGAIRDARRAGALRGDDQRALGAGADRRRRALDHAGAGRPALGRAPRPLPRRGAARRRRARRSSTWAALAPLALPDLPERDRPPPGRGAPARPRALLARRPAALGLGRRSRLRAEPRPRVEAAATGAGRPG